MTTPITRVPARPGALIPFVNGFDRVGSSAWQYAVRMMQVPESPAKIDRRRFMTDALTLGAMAHLLPSPTAALALGAAGTISVLDAIPPGLHAAIRSGKLRSDIAIYVDRAARGAASRGLPLLFPTGTYPMTTWQPPAGLTVLTGGRGTVFRQSDTRGKPQRFIEVFADGVRLWPGGSATIDGGMTPQGANATGFNSGIRVHAGRGVRIARFECGDIYGHDLGGDVLETGCEAGGFLGRCTIGSIYGDNIYRNLLSVTGGASGSVVAVVQQSGCGLNVVDFEPDPTSAPVGDWTIGLVQGHRATVAGDAAAGINSVGIAALDLDCRRSPSVPAFDQGGVSERATPTLFQVGLRYRNIGNLRIGRARIANAPRGAILDIGEGADDATSGLVSIGALVIVNCGAASTYEVVTQKTRLLDIEEIDSTAKPSAGIATFLGGFRSTQIRVGRGRIGGTVVLASKGAFTANSLVVTRGGPAVFRNVEGRLEVTASQITSTDAVFDNCSGPIEVADTTLQTPTLARGSAQPRIRRSQINGRLVN